MDQRAIVTGGAGFIGSHVVDRLLAAGAAVVVVDDLSGGREANLAQARERGAELQRADIRDAAEMRRVIEDFSPSVVYHLAAQVSVARSVRDPEHDADVNVRGTATLLEAARARGVARFVYVSTGGALYGETDLLPTPEDAPIRPMSPYGQSKWTGEQYCDLYARLHGMSTVTLRLGNVYGPRQHPYGEAGVVAIFAERLRDRETPTVFGDGRQTRDYVFVGDVAEAVAAAGGAQATGPLNVGSARETSVLDLVEAMAAFAPNGFAPEHLPARSGEVSRSCLDPARAHAELGWRARTGLEDGLRATLG